MDLKLKDKKVLVTGSNKGIGLKTAELFLAEGAHVIINGRSLKSCTEAIEKLKKAQPNGKADFVIADVGTEEGVRAEEVASMVVFVASDKASMVSGAALRVDGGTAKVVF